MQINESLLREVHAAEEGLEQVHSEAGFSVTHYFVKLDLFVRYPRQSLT
jgi:hypothetical protein